MKKSFLGALCLVVCFVATTFAQTARTAPDLQPTGKGWGVSVEASSAAGKAKPGGVTAVP